MTNNGFTFFRSYYDVIKGLSKEDGQTLTTAIFEFAFESKEPQLTGMLSQLFILIRPNLESSIQKSFWGSLKGSSKASLNGEEKGSKKAKGKERSGLGKKKERKEKEYVAPTLEEVKLYFQEWGYNSDGATKAWNYYNEMKWHDKNGDQVKGWKGKMQSVWFRDEYKIRVAPAKEERDDNW